MAKKIYTILKDKDIDIVNTTCYNVQKIHEIVERKINENYNVYIIGKESHPEIKGILGISDNVKIYSDINLKEKAFICNQTTLNYKTLNETFNEIKKKNPTAEINNEVCSATRERQEAIRNNAYKYDLIIVVGDTLSNNTDSLYKVCLEEGVSSIKVETLDDMMVDLEHCALPLASAITNFKPFIVFAVKRFFENEFGGGVGVKVINSKGQIEYAQVKDPMMVFSDEAIEREISRFIHGFSDRFSPVQVPIETADGKTKIVSMVFKGRNITAEQYANGDTAGESSLIDRKLTWCDVFFMAACEATKDKAVTITRFPVDSAYNMFPSKVRVSTIKETEPIYVNGEFYRWYPKIREKDISSNTSNRFIDTLNICNLLLKGITGDYKLNHRCSLR